MRLQLRERDPISDLLSVSYIRSCRKLQSRAAGSLPMSAKTGRKNPFGGTDGGKPATSTITTCFLMSFGGHPLRQIFYNILILLRKFKQPMRDHGLPMSWCCRDVSGHVLQPAALRAAKDAALEQSGNRGPLHRTRVIAPLRAVIGSSTGCN